MQKYQQLSLLPTPETTNQNRYELIVEKVPLHLSLGPERYKIVSQRFQGDDLVVEFKIPGQWSKQEAMILLRDIQGARWQIPEGAECENRPKDWDLIYELCRSFCLNFGHFYMDKDDHEFRYKSAEFCA